MSPETIHEITSAVLDVLLIFSGAYALHIAWIVSSWYKEKFKELDKLEEEINIISENLQTDRLNKLTMAQTGRTRYQGDIQRNEEKEKEIKEKGIEILKEKRNHILDRMPFVEFFKK